MTPAQPAAEAVSEAPPKTPAERLIRRFGVKTVAGWTGRHYARVHAWTWPVSKGGTGGVIPHKNRPKIIEGAKRDLGEDLTYADFEPQGDEAYLQEDAA